MGKEESEKEAYREVAGTEEAFYSYSRAKCSVGNRYWCLFEPHSKRLFVLCEQRKPEGRGALAAEMLVSVPDLQEGGGQLCVAEGSRTE